MADWIATLMGSLGHWGVALLMFLENVFPPIPSELIMPSAGFAANQGELQLLWVIVAGALGSILGQFPLYYLGRALGGRRLHVLADRYGKWVAVSGRDIERASAWLRRRGPVAVLLCRLVPGLRSLISLPAGVARMNLAVFTLYSTLGITAWGALLAGLGYAFGHNYARVERVLGPIGTILWIALGVLALAWLGWRMRGCYTHSRERCPFRDDASEPRDEHPASRAVAEAE